VLDRAREQGLRAHQESLDARLRTEHALQLALQICLDVGAHLIAELGLGPPGDYRGVVSRLAQAGVLDEALAGRLANAAGLRNRLVHGYAQLDDHRVFAALDPAQLDDHRVFAALDHLDDLRQFAAASLRAAEER